MAELKDIIDNHEPVDALYEELCRRTKLDLSTLSHEDLKNLCDASEAIAGVHSKRTTDNAMSSLFKQLEPMLTGLLKQLNKPPHSHDGD